MPVSREFTWTASEIKTYTGFYVAPGNQNPERDEVTYLVVRRRDDASSELCKSIEEVSLSAGGIVIRDQDAVRRGFSSEYRTQLFHPNCRCKLVIKPKAFGDSTDYLAFSMAVSGGSISDAEMSRIRSSLNEDLLERYRSYEYRRSVKDIFYGNNS